MKKITILAAIFLGLSGCAGTSEPTHRWVSAENYDRAQYRADHARCQAAHNLEAESSEVNTTSTAFAAYKQCMNDEGYVLTAYNGQ